MEPGFGEGAFAKEGERILRRGHLVTLAEGTFRGPDGTRFDREIVHHPGAVSVVPLVDDETVLLVRQYRAAVEVELLALARVQHGMTGDSGMDEDRRRHAVRIATVRTPSTASG